MAIYLITIRDAGAPVTGLTPTLLDWVKLADGTATTPVPTIAEIGNGKYRLSVATPTDARCGTIDAGDTLDDADRYIDVLVTPYDYSIANADAPISDVPTTTELATALSTVATEATVLSRASQASVDAVPTNAELATALSPLATAAALAPLALENTVAAVASLIDLRPTEDELATALSPLAKSNDLEDLLTTTELSAALAAIAKENTVAALGEAIEDLPTVTTLAEAVAPLALEETIANIPTATNTLLGNIHGTGPWGPTDAATGANDVSIRYIDDNNLPIEDVLVLIRASDDITRKEEKQTDSDGYINTRLDNGIYKIRPFKPQHSFTMPQELTVNGTTIVVYRGHYIAPSTPTPGMQTLYGNLGNWISGEFDNVEITIAGKEKNQIVGGLIMTTAPRKVQFTPSGYFEAAVPIGVREQIVIKHNGHIVYDKTTTITPDATMDLATI